MAVGFRRGDAGGCRPARGADCSGRSRWRSRGTSRSRPPRTSCFRTSRRRRVGPAERSPHRRAPGERPRSPGVAPAAGRGAGRGATQDRAQPPRRRAAAARGAHGAARPARAARRGSRSRAAMATQLQGALRDALDDLRDLARGIYPPLLADKGPRRRARSAGPQGGSADDGRARRGRPLPAGGRGGGVLLRARGDAERREVRRRALGRHPARRARGTPAYSRSRTTAAGSMPMRPRTARGCRGWRIASTPSAARSRSAARPDEGTMVRGEIMVADDPGST